MKPKPFIRFSGPPPVVESAKYVSNFDRTYDNFISEGFDSAVGPRHPRVLWKAAFRSLGEFLGLAADGTLYFGDSIGLYAIRDGKQQWGYKVPDGGIGALFDTEGRVRVEV